MARLKSTALEKLGNKNDLIKNTWIVLGRGIRLHLLCELRVMEGSKVGMGDENMR